MADTWLVVGLGNPGDRYAKTRHNVGQMVADELAARLRATFGRHPRAQARVAEGRSVPGGPKLVVAKSNGYMNTSGGPVAQLADYYGVDNERVIVVHDELDLPFDTLKIKQGGGHGGHNGLRDIVSALGGGDFVRVRVGIGRPPGRQDAADYVLREFAPPEREHLAILVQEAADAVELIAADGVLVAQQKVHAPSDSAAAGGAATPAPRAGTKGRD
ncbi:peptidyl-tRNA hydrolase [Pseudoclavibacter endophyticus]|uniref:Peptidyl-tRNA hydrolase n=1 Tax=Pseudoclavibacter endophyticus TaxID=1778590 RepID=A0A6H9WPD8_9MICO|nr:aminoacyl-tRNA hydrolase [Pseudoclavibacter endophyticus]KAB1649601.1 aminoacyl-tRNA hydrolase [Pseudoclavibacter endophyticus]GGA61316.1 peptidyl-tRNA hydrolase [Pseudoclavibacter endophyticus]